MIELKQITKSFGAMQALRGIDLKIEAGTIHGIVGENGAGKSTAMNILYGMIPPDSGTIAIAGTPVTIASPQDAMRRGIGMVHQHFALSSTHTALDNVILGAEFPAQCSRLSAWFRPIDRSAARGRLQELIHAFGFNIAIDRRVCDLPIGQQQQTEILKLLYRGAEVLIFDEPTAVLTPQESQLLLLNLQRLRAEGKAIILITHKLRDIVEIADQVTIFRSGAVVGACGQREKTIDELASMMVGRSIQCASARRPAQRIGKVVCALRNVVQKKMALGSEAGRLKGIDLELRQGEIVGIAGVEGNGQSEVIRALSAPHEAAFASGTLIWNDAPASSDDAGGMRRRGLAIIPEKRLEEGLIAAFSLRENLLLGQSGKGVAAEAAIVEFDIRPAAPEALGGQFSGGNQQKIVVARECAGEPPLLIAAQPTRGVDCGAQQVIHDRLLRLRDAGTAILLVSSDLDEIRQLADRIFVMYEGMLSPALSGATSEAELGALMSGHGRLSC